MDQIRNKIQTIVANLGTNTGFIQKIRGELTAISQKLQQVIQSRAALQKIQEQNKREVEVAKQALAASQLKVNEINTALQTATANSARQLQQLQQQMRQEQQAAQQKIAAAEANARTTQQAINELDTQLNQISQVVQTQTTLLNEANSGDQNNLFNHINGINQILQNILSGGPVVPPPPPNQQIQYPPGLVVPNQQFERQALANQQCGAPPGFPPRPGVSPGRGGKKMRKSRRVKKTMKKRRRNTRRYRK